MFEFWHALDGGDSHLPDAGLGPPGREGLIAPAAPASRVAVGRNDAYLAWFIPRAWAAKKSAITAEASNAW